MTGRLLDVSTLPFDQTYPCSDGSKIDMREFLDRHRYPMQALAEDRLVKANASFGYAMARPTYCLDYMIRRWYSPESFVWFVGGWGPERDRYIANAVRKLIAMLRYNDGHTAQKFLSTLDLQFIEHTFEHAVVSQNDDGTFPLGDYPYGGAVLQKMGSLKLVGAVSCLSQFEDDFIAKLILGGVGQQIVIGDRLLPG